MSKPNYRVILTYDAERKIFHARAPELEHCAAEGATRAEAIGRVEEEIDAQLANMLSHGTTPPRSVDEETFSGEFGVKVSKNLHRDLVYQARAEGIDLDHLVGELLASAMEGRKQHRAQRGGNRVAQEHMPHDNIGNRHDGGGAGGPRRGGFGGGRNNNNYQLLDDRANFIEYVRGLEQGGGHAHGGHGGRGPQGGGPGMGGGGDRRRRRGGRGGQQGQGQGQGMNGDRGNFRPGGYGNGGPNGGNQPRNGNPGAPMNSAPAPMNASAPPSAPPASDSHGGSHDDGDGNA